jgi:phage shock protein A
MNDETRELRAPAPLDPGPTPDTGADYNEAGLPTFEHVRDRIENRFAVATGAAELAGDPSSIDEQLAERERAAREKLESIRRSLRDE